MYRFLKYLLFLSFIGYRLSLIVPVHALYDPAPSLPQQQYVPNEIIVKFRPQKTPQSLQTQVLARQERSQNLIGSLQNLGQNITGALTGQAAPEANLEQYTQIKNSLGIFDEQQIFGEQAGQNSLANYYLLKSSGVDIDQALQTLSQSKIIESTEPNYIYYIMAVPNDPYFDQLWGMSKIQAPSAWDVTIGSDAVVVAVVDTGVNYNHQDFEAGLIIKGPNYVYGGNDPMDDHGHGTHVAGTIGAIGNNGRGVVGVNWRVKIMAIKVLSRSGAGSLTTIANGIKYAADNGADVVNMSLGGPGTCPSLMREVLANAQNKGVVLVAAAGNENTNAAYFCPASDPNVITVSATDSSDRKAGFSNYGDVVDVAAPGVSILSTTGSGYQTMSGTSMASPHVAGLAALILANNSSLTSSQVRNVLASSADDLGTTGKDPYYGYGRINAARALGGGGITPTATPGGPTPTPTPVPTLPPGVTPTATPIPGPPTATPIPGRITTLKLEVMLQGIYSQKPEKQFTVKIKNQSREVTKASSFASDDKGIYASEISLSNDNFQAGAFDILVKTNYFLQKKFAGINLRAGENTLTRVAEQDLLRAGDLDNSGTINQQDVEQLKSAYSPFSPTTNPADLNLNLYVNSLDYSLLVTNLNKSDEQ